MHLLPRSNLIQRYTFAHTDRQLSPSHARSCSLVSSLSHSAVAPHAPPFRRCGARSIRTHDKQRFIQHAAYPLARLSARLRVRAAHAGSNAFSPPLSAQLERTRGPHASVWSRGADVHANPGPVTPPPTRGVARRTSTHCHIIVIKRPVHTRAGSGAPPLCSGTRPTPSQGRPASTHPPTRLCPARGGYPEEGALRGTRRSPSPRCCPTRPRPGAPARRPSCTRRSRSTPPAAPST